jgi:hypothetical protein
MARNAWWSVAAPLQQSPQHHGSRVAFQEGLHVLRWDQADIVAERSQMSADTMRTGAGFYSDQARRQIGQLLSELMP